MSETGLRLKAQELNLRRRFAAADASPFAGHAEAGDAAAIARALRSVVRRDPIRLARALKTWPATTVWAMTRMLARRYGEDDHKVWALIDEGFGTRLGDGPNGRSAVGRQFARACDGLDLVLPDQGRGASEIMVQTGVARAQLPALAEAFLRAEAAEGLPDPDDTLMLNAWEDAAVERAPLGLNRMRRAILTDLTGYHALVYVRCREGRAPESEFERAFATAIAEVAAGRKVAAAPDQPRLSWTDDGVVLRLPSDAGAGDGDWTVTQGGMTRTHLPGARIPVTGWDAAVSWERPEGGGGGGATVVPPGSAWRLFDAETGRPVGAIPLGESGTVRVDAEEVVVLGTKAFRVDGEPAMIHGYGFIRYVRPGERGGLRIEKLDTRADLAKRVRPRLTFCQGVILRGPRGPLLGRDAVLAWSTTPTEEGLELAITQEGPEAVYDVEPNGTFALPAPTGPLRLRRVRAVLRRPGSGRALVRVAGWYWPGLDRLDDGTLFADGVPVNFDPDGSISIIPTLRGDGLTLEATAGERGGQAAFVGPAGERVAFRLAHTGVTARLDLPNGRSRPLVLGETLSVGEAERGGALVVRSPRGGTLLIGEEVWPDGFGARGVRALPLAGLTTGRDRTIGVQLPSGAIDVAHLVRSDTAERVELLASRPNLRFRLDLGWRADALRLAVQDAEGGRPVFDLPLGHRPTENVRCDWAMALPVPGTDRGWQVEIDPRAWRGGAGVVQLLARPEGENGFTELRCALGGRCAFALSGRSDDTSLGLDLLTDWLRDAYHSVFARQVEDALMPIWHERIAGVWRNGAGAGRLLTIASDGSEAGPEGWVASVHPVSVVPELYGVESGRFAVLQGLAGAAPATLSALATLAHGTAEAPFGGLDLAPCVKLAYANAGNAAERPRRFSFERYAALLGTEAAGGRRGRSYKPGCDLGSLAHGRAAVRTLTRRLREAEEGPWGGDARLGRLTGLARHVRPGAPADLCAALGCAGDRDALHAALPDLLWRLARASRMGDAAAEMAVWSRQAGLRAGEGKNLTALGLRLGPELFAYFLLLWELNKLGEPNEDC